MTDSAPSTVPPLRLVCCASDVSVLQRCLLASPCVKEGKVPLEVYFNARSAADAFNRAMDAADPQEWLVWVHQDVVLPGKWDQQFRTSLAEACSLFESLAIAGAYGVRGSGSAAVRAGRVLDRGRVLDEPAPLPCPVDSLDEMLFAVQGGAGLRLDPDLGFDFYATDLVLQARARGLDSAVVDAYCEHWSNTPATPPLPEALCDRIRRSARVFEMKWAHALPLTTPCFDIQRVGDVAREIDRLEIR